MRTVDDYIALMRHTLGKTPATGHNLYHTLNDAGRRLFTAQEWTWRTQGPVSLPVVAGDDTLDLPHDFGQELECWVPDTGPYIAVQVVTRGDMAILRRQTVVTINTGTFYVCFEGSTSTPGTPTRPRALAYPTPATSGSPTLQLMYTRRWVTVDAGDANRQVQIPEDFEDALATGACLLAWNRENPDRKMDPSEYASEIERLKGEDGVRQSAPARITGGAASRRTGTGMERIDMGIAQL